MKAFLMAMALTSALAATALAATETRAPGAPAQRVCFSSSDWRGWKARDEKTMYLKVGMHDVYEVGFKHGCRQAQYPGASLITVFHGSDRVCAPLDLDIKVTDNGRGAFATPCIATSLRKLPAAEAKAIPKEFRP